MGEIQTNHIIKIMNEILLDQQLKNVLDKLEYGDAVVIGSIFGKVSKLAKLGELILNESLCHWDYQYKDGDCCYNSCKFDKVCKLRNEILNGGK